VCSDSLKQHILSKREEKIMSASEIENKANSAQDADFFDNIIRNRQQSARK